MNEQLRAIVVEFEQASARLRTLIRDVPESVLRTRPDAHRWSATECVAHLNLTSEAFLPEIQSALAEGHEAGHRGRRRYRRDPVGWLLWRTMGPPVRLARTRTSAAFIPEGEMPLGALLEDFDRLQSEQVACVKDADGLDLQRLRISSPFDRRVRYNLYACLSILPRHQHRHLWQAERAVRKG